MTRIALDCIHIGMVAATPIVDAEGNLIAAAGADLTSEHVRQLRAVGASTVDVAMVDVFFEPSGEQEPPPPHAVAQRLAAHHVARLFQGSDTRNPLIHELKRLCIARRARQLLEAL